MNEMQKKAIGEVCYLPMETVKRGAVRWFDRFTVKLTVNAGFE